MSKLTPTALQRWRADPAGFIETVLVNPGPGPGAGKPFVLLEAERAFLKHALSIGPNGRLLHPELIYAAPKKSGKSAFGAILVITVVVLFGDRFAEAYCVANDLEQAQGLVFEACCRIVEASPLLRREAKVSADRITFFATGATIQALASNYASAAGGHPTISVFDELWGYTSERSRRLWDELIPVPTRDISCRLVVSHAGFSGESVLLEELHKRGLAQPEVGLSLHAGDGLLMFWSHEPVAPWQDEAWFAEMRRSLRPHQYLRMVENRFAAAESSFINLADWDACVDDGLHPLIEARDLPVWIGVDASAKHDTTAIAAFTYADQRVRLVAHRIFVPKKHDPINFEQAIEATLIDYAQRYAVRKILFDPWQMLSVSQRLQHRGLPIKEFPQTVPNLTEASQNFYELITGRNILMHPNADIRLAVSRAVAVESSRGWRIAKEKASHKIDIVVAMAMAALAAVKSASEREAPRFVPPFVHSVPRSIPGGSVAPPAVYAQPAPPQPAPAAAETVPAVRTPVRGANWYWARGLRAPVPAASEAAPKGPIPRPLGRPEGYRVGPGLEPWRGWTTPF
jgi:Phage Terminase